MYHAILPAPYPPRLPHLLETTINVQLGAEGCVSSQSLVEDANVTNLVTCHLQW